MIDASIIAAAKPTAQPCSLDAIDGSYAKQVTVSVGKPHVFRRWLLNSSREPAGKFSLVLKGNHDFATPATTADRARIAGPISRTMHSVQQALPLHRLSNWCRPVVTNSRF